MRVPDATSLTLIVVGIGRALPGLALLDQQGAALGVFGHHVHLLGDQDPAHLRQRIARGQVRHGDCTAVGGHHQRIAGLPEVGLAFAGEGGCGRRQQREGNEWLEHVASWSWRRERGTDAKDCAHRQLVSRSDRCRSPPQPMRWSPQAGWPDAVMRGAVHRAPAASPMRPHDAARACASRRWRTRPPHPGNRRSPAGSAPDPRAGPVAAGRVPATAAGCRPCGAATAAPACRRAGSPATGRCR
jgi:hypothetical protein